MTSKNPQKKNNQEYLGTLRKDIGITGQDTALLHMVLGILPVGVMLIDKDGKIIHANPASKKIWGGVKFVGMEKYGEYKAWRTDTGEIIKADDWAAAKAITEGKSTIEEELEIEAFDGIHKIILNTAIPIQDDAKNILGAIVVEKDITGEREAQIRVNASNAMLQLFARAVSHKEYLDEAVNLIRKWTGCEAVGLRVVDEYGNIPYESYVGYSNDFLELENWLSLKKDQCICSRVINDSQADREKDLLTPYGLFYSNDAPKFIAGLDDKDQKRYRGNCINFGYKSIAATPIRYRGKILGAIHYVDSRANRVPRKLVESIEHVAPLIGEAVNRYSVEEEFQRNFKALKENQARLELALEGANLVMWEWNVATGEAYFTSRFARMFGYSLREIEPHIDFWKNTVHPDDLPKVMATIGANLEGKTPTFEAEYRMKTKSGQWKWVISRGKVIERDPAGNPLRVIRTVLDITDHKKAEEALRQKDREAGEDPVHL